ncbi:MAG: methyltransferase domain-containing protein [Rhodospirillales bacterium]|nr:methyltransferase domain-containing protein [Rhodospirillales bacterium]
MATDVHAAAQFYATRGGAVAARLLREHLLAAWPDLTGQTLLGLGYTMPYLRAWRGSEARAAARIVAAIPAQLGLARWPPDGPGLVCAVEEGALPFPDLCFDRVLLVHGIESAENARAMLREIWRVLKDDGRVLVVAPNRSGLWAHAESTPFGQGQPYSPGQIGRLLARSLFRVERRQTALFVPPLQSRLVLKGARLWERAGCAAPRLAGVTITEATKDLYGAVPAGPKAQRRRVLAPAV